MIKTAVRALFLAGALLAAFAGMSRAQPVVENDAIERLRRERPEDFKELWRRMGPRWRGHVGAGAPDAPQAVAAHVIEHLVNERALRLDDFAVDRFARLMHRLRLRAFRHTPHFCVSEKLERAAFEAVLERDPDLFFAILSAAADAALAPPPTQKFAVEQPPYVWPDTPPRFRERGDRIAQTVGRNAPKNFGRPGPPIGTGPIRDPERYWGHCLHALAFTDYLLDVAPPRRARFLRWKMTAWGTPID